MKTVIEMAIEAGFPFNKYGLLQGNDDNEIDADAMFERFAELVRAEAVADEREVIAQSLDKQADLAPDEIDRQWAQEMAAAVRARSNT